MKAPRRTMEPGTARKPARLELVRRSSWRTCWGPCPTRGPCRRLQAAPVRITWLACRRKDSSTAFFSHWRAAHSPSIFSATRSSPESSRSMASSTASRMRPRVVGLSASRASQACFDLGSCRSARIRLMRLSSTRIAFRKGSEVARCDSARIRPSQAWRVRPDQHGGHAEVGGGARFARVSSKKAGAGADRWRGPRSCASKVAGCGLGTKSAASRCGRFLEQRRASPAAPARARRVRRRRW